MATATPGSTGSAGKAPPNPDLSNYNNPSVQSAGTLHVGPKTPPVAPSPDPTGLHEVTLLFDTENGASVQPPKQHPIVVTESLARVFVRAATLAPTSEPPLQFSTLLIAMLVDEDDWLDRQFKAQQVDFKAIESKRKYHVASLRGLNHQSLAAEYLTSQSARQALEEAERIARATAHQALDTHHLMAAYPVLRGWHLRDFENFKIDRLEWARALGAEMARRFPLQRTYWARYANRAAPVPLTSFSADVYTQEDLLDIDRSVDALGLLMASTRTVTPLAIGVFGPWGSGKTFFMRHLQKRIVGLRSDEQPRIAAWIEKRSAGSATPEDAPLYFGEIAQVEFNAWQYNESNLVASLVEHLFRNLRILPNEGDQELDERRDKVMQQVKVLNTGIQTADATLASAQKNLETARNDVQQAATSAEAARRAVEDKSKEIRDRNAEMSADLTRLDETLKAATLEPGDVDPAAVVSVALGPLAPLFKSVRDAATTAREQLFDWREFFGRVFSWKGLVVIALCLVVPLILTLTHYLEAQWSAFVGLVTVVTTWLGSALDVFKRNREKFEAKLAELDREQQRHQAEVEEKIRQQQQSVTEAAQKKLAALGSELEALRSSLAQREAAMTRATQNLAEQAQQHDAQLAARAEAEKKLSAAEADLKRLTSALLLEEFITDRANSNEYSKQLGFLALVRRDIERLSKLIEDANRKWLAPDNSDGRPLINRIVLYIDDLDRCKESTVLAVLEVVHLLLAFPLFVCVVAVDPRWVEKCLREARKQMFVDEDAPSGQAAPGATATVGDYLEKIFQIPMWMSPIESETRAALVNTLLGPTAAPVARAAGNGAAAHDAAVSSVVAAESSGAFDTLVAGKRGRPDPLRILPEEAAFVTQIADLLSDRPRALKRFVNSYRLLKASLPDIEREKFVTAELSSPHRICLAQLAFITSHPRLAAQLVKKLQCEDEPLHTAPSPPLSVAFDAWLEKNFDASDAVRTTLAELPTQTVALPDFRRWLELTSRYMFHRVE